MLKNRKLIGTIAFAALVLGACGKNAANNPPPSPDGLDQSITTITPTEATSHTITKLVNPDQAMLVGLDDNAHAGTQIKFAVTLFPGYELHAVELKDSSDLPLSLGFSDGKYQFTMPDDDVTISAITSLTEFIIAANVETGSNIEVVDNSMKTLLADKHYTAKMGDSISLKVNVTDTTKRLGTVELNGTNIAIVDGVATFAMPGRPSVLDIKLIERYRTITAVNSTHYAISTSVTRNSEVIATTDIVAKEVVSVNVTRIEGSDVDNEWTYDTISVKNASTDAVIASRVYPNTVPFTFTMPADDVIISLTERSLILYSGKVFIGSYAGVLFSPTSGTTLTTTSLDIQASGMYKHGTTDRELTYTEGNNYFVDTKPTNINAKTYFSSDGQYIFMNSYTVTSGYEWEYMYLFKKGATTVSTSSFKGIYNRLKDNDYRATFALSTHTFDGVDVTVLVYNSVVYFDVIVEMIGKYSALNYYSTANATNGPEFVVRQKDGTFICAAKYAIASSATNTTTTSAKILDPRADAGTYTGPNGSLVLDGYNKAVMTIDSADVIGRYEVAYDNIVYVTINGVKHHYAINTTDFTYTIHTPSFDSALIGSYGGINLTYNNSNTSNRTMNLNEDGLYYRDGDSVSRSKMVPVAGKDYYVDVANSGKLLFTYVDDNGSAYVMYYGGSTSVYLYKKGVANNVASSEKVIYLSTNRSCFLTTATIGGEAITIFTNINTTSGRYEAWFDVTVNVVGGGDFNVTNAAFTVIAKNGTTIGSGTTSSTSATTMASFEYPAPSAEVGTYSDGTDTLILDGFGKATLSDIPGTYYISDGIIILTVDGTTHFIEINKEDNTFTSTTDPSTLVDFDPFANAIYKGDYYDVSNEGIKGVNFTFNANNTVSFSFTSVTYGRPDVPYVIDWTTMKITITMQSHFGTDSLDMELSISSDLKTLTILTNFGNEIYYSTANNGVVTRTF